MLPSLIALDPLVDPSCLVLRAVAQWCVVEVLGLL